MEAFDQTGCEKVAFEILAELGLHPGAQDLDGHELRFAGLIRGFGLVHLGDRGGGHRRSEFGEQF